MTNLLRNPTFDPSWGEGERQHPEHPNIYLPDGWALDWIDGEPFEGIHDDPPNLAAHRPEAKIINKWEGLEPELTPDTSYAWDIFVTGPLHATPHPRVPLVVPAGTYRVELKIWPKLHMMSEQRQHPDDPYAGEVGLRLNDGETWWMSGLSYAGYNELEWEFDWGGGELMPYLPMKGKYPIDNTFFLHFAGLTRVDDGEPSDPGESQAIAAALDRLSTAVDGLSEAVRGFSPGAPEPPDEDSGIVAPREAYDRTYVLLPPDADASWAHAVIDGSWAQHRFTVGSSADDAGFGLQEHRRVIAVNPSRWGDLPAWFEEHYPGLWYYPIEAATPADLTQALRNLDADPEGGPGDDTPPEGPEIIDIRDQLATNPDSPWFPWAKRSLDEITHVFVHHSAGALSSDIATVEAIARYHTRSDRKNRPGICYTYVIGADGTTWLTSDPQNAVFSQGSQDYPGDENRWGLGVCLLGTFTAGREPTQAQLGALIDLIDYLERTTGRELAVWGHKDVASTACPGDTWPWIEGWGREPGPAPEPGPVLIGFNDYPGPRGEAADWLRGAALPGLIVRPVFLGESPQQIDYSLEAEVGIRAIVNLRYSWSVDLGGQGTLPLPDTPQWRNFVQAAAQTIQDAQGVWGWTIGNEHNNPREFPNAGALSPAAVVRTYNTIQEIVGGQYRMSPGALDPYNALAGNPREWLSQIYAGIHGADFVAAHGYVRGPNPALVGSELRFSHAPLTWQYLNFPGCVDALLEALPAEYRGLDVYITEFNHLWTSSEGNWGWVDDERAREIVLRGYEDASARGYHLALYRWAGDEWGVWWNGSVLGAVTEILRGA